MTSPPASFRPSHRSGLPVPMPHHCRRAVVGRFRYAYAPTPTPAATTAPTPTYFMNVRRETPRPSDTACWPCGFSSIAPTRDGVDRQIRSTIFKRSLPVAVRSTRGEFRSRNDNKRVEESKGIQRRVTRTCPARTTSFSFTRTEATRPAPGAGTSISIFIASMTKRMSPGWTESPAFTLTFTIMPGISAVTSISVDPPGSKEFLDVRPFDALPLHRGLEGFQDLRRVRRVAVDGDALDLDPDVLTGDRGHLPLLQESDEAARDLVRVPGLLRAFEGERTVREVVQLDEPFRYHRETALLGDLVCQGMGHRVQEEFRIVFLDPLDDALRELLVVDRDRVHGPMGLDVLQLHAVRLEEAGEGPDLVDHVVLELVLRHLDVAPTESLAIGKAGVGADRHPVLLRQLNGLPHHVRVARVEAAGDVRGRDEGHDLLVPPQLPDPIALAHVAVQIHSHRHAAHRPWTFDDSVSRFSRSSQARYPSSIRTDVNRVVSPVLLWPTRSRSTAMTVPIVANTPPLTASFGRRIGSTPGPVVCTLPTG